MPYLAHPCPGAASGNAIAHTPYATFDIPAGMTICLPQASVSTEDGSLTFEWREMSAAPGTASSPVSVPDASEVEEPEPGSEGWLVVKEAGNGGLVVQSVRDALHEEAIIGALDEAKTYGEFRRLLPEGEWENVLDRLRTPEAWEDADEAWYLAEDFDWNTPFDASDVAGYYDGDYPAWAQASLGAVLPEDLLQKYATVTHSVHNGPYFHIPHASASELIADLRARGYTVEEGAHFLRGW